MVRRMMLEELIHKRFSGSESLAKHLALFCGTPAVFSPEPPDESQEGWGGNIQYPQIIYNFDLQANEERHSAGTLSVSLLCQNTTEITPEAIEPLVRDCHEAGRGYALLFRVGKDRCFYHR